ncbi:MAG: anti-sigma factor family protein [Bryobacteraceae bacterium]
MNCWSAKRRKADFVDGRLRGRERSRIASHLAECQSCSLEFEHAGALRSTLANLPPPQPPARLRMALRVSASQEKHAIETHQGSRLRRFCDYWLFRLDEMMRPLTLPATGGILSSFLLFALLAANIGTSAREANYEVPLFYADHIDANLVPVQLRSSVILTLSLNGSGRITDYAFQDASSSFVGDVGRLQYNTMAVPNFPSVLALAQPINEDISIKLTPLFFRR